MHKRLSRAITLLILAACLTVLGARALAQSVSGGCVTSLTLVPVLARGAGMSLTSQYGIGVDCAPFEETAPGTCDIHYYADLYYTQDGGDHWYSLWGSQDQCLTIAGDCGTSRVTWIPTATTYRTTNGFPAMFQVSMWGYKGECTAGNGNLLDFQESARVTIDGPSYGP